MNATLSRVPRTRLDRDAWYRVACWLTRNDRTFYATSIGVALADQPKGKYPTVELCTNPNHVCWNGGK